MAKVVARAQFFEKNGGVEPYLINPPLIIANGPNERRRITTVAKVIRMTRNRKGQFVKASRQTNPVRKRSVSVKRRKAARRSNPPFWTAGALLNPRRSKRRGTTRAVVRRGHRRHNPPSAALSGGTMVAGIPIPRIGDLLALAGGIMGPPIIQGFALQYAPTFGATTTGRYVIKAVSYVVPPLIGYALAGRRGLAVVVAGELAALTVQGVQYLLKQIAPSVPTGQVRGYNPNIRNLRGYNPRVQLRGRGRGGMGAYTSVTTGQQLGGAPRPVSRSWMRASRFQR